MQCPRVLLAMFVCFASTNCNTPARNRPIQSASEWLSLSAGILDQNGSGTNANEDTPEALLQGGFAFSRGSLRPSIEMGLGVSRQDANPAPSEGATFIDFYRATGGFRLEYDIPASPTTVWGQTGIYYRWTNDSTLVNVPSDQESDGYYVGAGLFFWMDRTSAIGPFVTHFVGRGSGRSETFFGFQVVLRHSGSLGIRRSNF